MNQIKKENDVSKVEKKQLIEFLEGERQKYQVELQKFGEKVHKFKKIQEMYIQEKNINVNLEENLNQTQLKVEEYRQRCHDTISTIFSLFELFLVPNPNDNFSFETHQEEITKQELISNLFKGVTQSIQKLHPIIVDLSNATLLRIHRCANGGGG